MKKGKKNKRRKEERKKERRVEEGKKKGKKSEERKEEKKDERKTSRVWKVSLNIPSYTVKLRGTERRGSLELVQVSVKHRCKPV